MLLSAMALCAHLHTVVPDQTSSRKGREASFLYLFCHPFEHEVVATKRPEKVFAVAPSGAVEDLLPTLKEAKEGFRFSFTPQERGDYYVVVAAAREEGDAAGAQAGGAAHGASIARAKAIVHVQSQTGWDRPLAQGLDIVPLTRPYGLPSGSVFRGRVVLDGAPVAGCSVEMERFNPAPPRELPDEEFITSVVKTDELGYFVTSFPETGWWSITAAVETAPQGTRPASRRAMTFWLPVGSS